MRSLQVTGTIASVRRNRQRLEDDDGYVPPGGHVAASRPRMRGEKTAGDAHTNHANMLSADRVTCRERTIVHRRRIFCARTAELARCIRCWGAQWEGKDEAGTPG